MAEIELRVPPRVEYLALVRAVVGAAVSLGPGIADERVDDLRLAVSEATTNAIESHLEGRIDEPIRISCAMEADHVMVKIKRLEFERGLGLPLMRALTDEHDISPTPTGTTVSLRINMT